MQLLVFLTVSVVFLYLLVKFFKWFVYFFFFALVVLAFSGLYMFVDARSGAEAFGIVAGVIIGLFFVSTVFYFFGAIFGAPLLFLWHGVSKIFKK